MHNNQMNADQ